MDGFTIKPNAAVPKFTARARQPAQPIETELDAAKTVNATGDGAEQRERPPEHPPHDIVADPEIREVINRENDVRAHANSGAQPDQALLRYRAYRPHTETENPAPPEPHANIKA